MSNLIIGQSGFLNLNVASGSAPSSYSFDFLLVGGGGGPNSFNGSFQRNGGDGGQLVSGSITPSTGNVYVFSIGAGGTSGGYYNNNTNNSMGYATNGLPSKITLNSTAIYTANGGLAANTGANYGGNGAYGAGGAGLSNGNGGNGLTNSITGSSVYYAGGGSGFNNNNAGLGAIGRGGSSHTNGSNDSSNFGLAGGCIISIPAKNFSGVYTGNPSVIINGTKLVLTFTSAGSYTA